jgi:hypothetical protein
MVINLNHIFEYEIHFLEMSERDNKIETLENEIDTLRSRAKMHEVQIFI